MNLYSLSQIQALLEDFSFEMKKKYGQNFLLSRDITERIAKSSICDSKEKCACIEIGPGIGVLTEQLCNIYDKVTSFEIDTCLIPILAKTMEGRDNLTVINRDILEVDLDKYIENEMAGYTVSVCANLPYYITTPIIMSLLQSCKNISKIVVMMQKEVALRLTAVPGSENYGAITPVVDYYAKAKKLFDVAPGNFFPRPDVTSTVVCFDIRDKKAVEPADEDVFFKTIRGAFAQRRKTLLNSLSSEFPFDKATLEEAVVSAGISPKARGETLDIKALCKLSNCLFEMMNK